MTFPNEDSDYAEIRALQRFVLRMLDHEDSVATAAGHGYGHLGLSPDLNAGWTNLDPNDNVRPSYDTNLVRTFSPDRVKDEVRLKRALVVAVSKAIEDSEPLGMLLTMLRSTACLWSQDKDFNPRWEADEMWEESADTEFAAEVLAIGSYKDTPLAEMSENDQRITRLAGRRVAPLLA